MKFLLNKIITNTIPKNAFEFNGNITGKASKIKTIFATNSIEVTILSI